MDFLLNSFSSRKDMLIIDSSIFVSFSSFSYLDACFQIFSSVSGNKEVKFSVPINFSKELKNVNNRSLLKIQSQYAT